MEKQYTPDKQKPIERKQKIVAAPIENKKKEEKPREETKKEIEAKVEEMKQEKKEEVKAATETKPETTPETKSEEKKTEKKAIVKKEKAIVNGKDLPISKKHSMAVCDFIRYRRIENVIPELEQVVILKRAIPMKGEIPHRKGNMMSGRYPVNTCKVFIKLLKTLNANSSVNGLEEPVISVAIANDAARPFKRGGSMRFKRSNIYLEAIEKKAKEKK